jgi:hypothetical protein
MHPSNDQTFNRYTISGLTFSLQGLRQTVSEADKALTQGLVPLVARTEAAARSEYEGVGVRGY